MDEIKMTKVEFQMAITDGMFVSHSGYPLTVRGLNLVVHRIRGDMKRWSVTGIALATATIYTVATPPCEYVETTECKD